VSSLSLFVGLIFVVVFFTLMIFFATVGKARFKRDLRDISAFTRLRRGIGLAVESGQRLHISLGHGGISGVRGASALVGLSILRRIARAASISDRPPVATSGDALVAILSQDTLQGEYSDIGAESQYDPTSGQLSGLSPFSYAVGTLPVIYDQHVSVNIIAGSFGSEVALLTDAAERNGSLSLAGSENLSAQSVLYASAHEPLVGEEFYASGAYIQAGPFHYASLRAQDILRWVLVGVILVGAALKLAGVL
jgi:hypothetical protein